MLSSKLAKPIVGAVVACAVTMAFSGAVLADDPQTQALKDQMKIMQQQMQQLQEKIDELSSKQAAQQAAGPPVSAKGTTGKEKEKGSSRFLVGENWSFFDQN